MSREIRKQRDGDGIVSVKTKWLRRKKRFFSFTEQSFVIILASAELSFHA